MSSSSHSASRDCCRLLEQGRDLVSKLSDEQYGFAPELGASTGAHLRHVIDYFDCLLSGSDAHAIDYTARQRCAELETSRAVGLRELERCIEALEKIEPRREQIALEVRCDEGDPWVGSTLARELRFVASHTTHHFALIRLTLAQRGIVTSDELGVSPSTLAYRARRRRQA
jgi:hypothetical protein